MIDFINMVIYSIQQRIAGKPLRDALEEIEGRNKVIDAQEFELSRQDTTISSLQQTLRDMTRRNRDLQRTVDNRNARAGSDALIAGVTRFGEVTQATALTYDEVQFPHLNVGVKVREDGFTLFDTNRSDDRTFTVRPFDQVDGKPEGFAHQIDFILS